MMYELIECTVLILLWGYVAVNTVIQVKGNKISIIRKKAASVMITFVGCLLFIWSLVDVIKTIQENIIKVEIFWYLLVILSAIWFITGIYLLVYCRKM